VFTSVIKECLQIRILKQTIIGRAISQVVSRRPLTAEARVRARVNPCGICSGQSGTGTGFFSEYFCFLLSIYHSTVAIQTNIILGMRNMLTEIGIHAWVLDPPHLQEKKKHYFCDVFGVTGFTRMALGSLSTSSVTRAKVWISRDHNLN
jgi:hypothetical protein